MIKDKGALACNIKIFIYCYILWTCGLMQLLIEKSYPIIITVELVFLVKANLSFHIQFSVSVLKLSLFSPHILPGQARHSPSLVTPTLLYADFSHSTCDIMFQFWLTCISRTTSSEILKEKGNFEVYFSTSDTSTNSETVRVSIFHTNIFSYFHANN